MLKRLVSLLVCSIIVLSVFPSVSSATSTNYLHTETYNFTEISTFGKDNQTRELHTEVVGRKYSKFAPSGTLIQATIEERKLVKDLGTLTLPEIIQSVKITLVQTYWRDSKSSGKMTRETTYADGTSAAWTGDWGEYFSTISKTGQVSGRLQGTSALTTILENGIPVTALDYWYGGLDETNAGSTDGQHLLRYDDGREVTYKFTKVYTSVVKSDTETVLGTMSHGTVTDTKLGAYTYTTSTQGINSKHSQIGGFELIDAQLGLTETLNDLYKTHSYADAEVIMHIGEETIYVTKNMAIMDKQLDVAPVVIQGSAMIPLRGVMEELCATVEWIGATSEVVVKNASTTVRLQLGSMTATVNGEQVKMSAPATLISGRTLIPLRFVSEALGAEVDYRIFDGARRITITTEGLKKAIPYPTNFINTKGLGNPNSPGVFNNTSNKLLTVNKSASYETNLSRLNGMVGNVYGNWYKPYLTQDGYNRGVATLVYNSQTNRYGLKIEGWRQSYGENNVAVANQLNTVLETMYYFTGDKEVAFALWSWLDAASIHDWANTDDFGFKDVSWDEQSGVGVAEMKGIQIEFRFKNGYLDYMWFY